MQAHRKTRPRVPSGFADPTNGSSVGHGETRGAKNLWEKPSCQKQQQTPTKLRIGSYNARTLRTEAKLEELLHELNKISWDIVGLSEVRRQGEECLKLQEGHVLYYRGKDGGGHEHGVGLLINKHVANNIKEIDSVSERILFVTLYITKKISLKVIHVYAPTTAASDAEVEQVLDDIGRCKRDISSTYTIVTGDFNAKIGSKRDPTETYMGNFGYGIRNTRGEMLLNFLELEKLYHMSSFYQKRPERKWTWASPGNKYTNEIDYILSTHKQIVRDVTVLNNFYTGSDHRLIRAVIQIEAKLERYTSICKKKRKVDAKFLNVNKDIYQQKVNDKISDINLNSDINILAYALKTSLCETAQELASSRRPSKQKFQQSTIRLLEERRLLITQGQSSTENFKSLCKKTRESVEQDIEAHRERIVKNIIDMHKGPKVFRKALQTGTQQISKLLDEHGYLITDRKKLLEVVEKYYENLYKSKKPRPQELISRKIENVGSEDIPDITTAEIRSALRKMKNGKTPGEDDIIIEMVKEGGDNVIKLIAIIFNKCLQECTIPK